MTSNTCPDYHLDIITLENCSACTTFKTVSLKNLSNCLKEGGISFDVHHLKTKNDIDTLPNGISHLVSWYPFFILTKKSSSGESSRMIYNAQIDKTTGKITHKQIYKSRYDIGILTWINDKIGTYCQVVTKKDKEGNIICLTNNSKLGNKKFNRKF